MKLFVYNPCARNKIANPKIHSPQNEAIAITPPIRPPILAVLGSNNMSVSKSC